MRLSTSLGANRHRLRWQPPGPASSDGFTSTCRLCGRNAIQVSAAVPVPDGARTARRGSPAQAAPHGDRNPVHNGKPNRTAGPSHSIAPDTLAYSTSTSNATLLGPCPDDTAARARSANTGRATSPDANAQPKAACGGSAEKVATTSAVKTRKAKSSEQSAFGLELGKQMLRNRQRRRKRQRQGRRQQKKLR